MPFKKGDKNINRNGRKAKYEELGLPSKLDEIRPIGQVLEILNNHIEQGSLKAAELWLAYYYGKPKESLKLDGTLKINALKIVRASNKGNSNK